MSTHTLVIQRGPYGFMFTVKDTGEPYNLFAPVGKVTMGSPAEAAGLHPSDMILAVNGNKVSGRTSLEVANMIRASSGHSIELTLWDGNVKDIPGSFNTEDSRRNSSSTHLDLAPTLSDIGPFSKAPEFANTRAQFSVPSTPRHSILLPGDRSESTPSGLTGYSRSADDLHHHTKNSPKRQSIPVQGGEEEEQNDVDEEQDVEETAGPKLVRKPAYASPEMSRMTSGSSLPDECSGKDAVNPAHRLQSKPKINFLPRRATGGDGVTRASPGSADSREESPQQQARTPQLQLNRVGGIIRTDEASDAASTGSSPATVNRTSPGRNPQMTLRHLHYQPKGSSPERGLGRYKRQPAFGTLESPDMPDVGIPTSLSDNVMGSAASHEFDSDSPSDQKVCSLCQKLPCTCQGDNEAVGPVQDLRISEVSEEVSAENSPLSNASPPVVDRQISLVSGHSASESPGSVNGDTDTPKNNKNLRKLKNFFGENSKHKNKGTTDSSKTPRIQEACRNPAVPPSSTASVKIVLYEGKAVKSTMKSYGLTCDDDHLFLTRERSSQAYSTSSSTDDSGLAIPLQGSSIEEEPDKKNKKNTYRLSHNPSQSECVIQFPDCTSAEFWTRTMASKGATLETPSTDQLSAPGKRKGQGSGAIAGVNPPRDTASFSPSQSPRVRTKMRCSKDDDEPSTSWVSASSASQKGKLQQAINKIKKGKKFLQTTSGTSYSLVSSGSGNSKHRSRAAVLNRVLPYKYVGSTEFDRQREEWFAQRSRATRIAAGSFGTPLHECPRSSYSPYIPLIVEVCVGVIEQYALNCVGIYRVSGNKAALDSLTGEFSKDLDDMDLDSVKWNDVHAVSGLLKAFLRKLPNPLIPNAMCSEFIEAIRSQRSHERRLLCLQRLLGVMACDPDNPEFRYHRETLAFLATHLAKVAQRESRNKMGVHNLALIFAPNLLRPEIEDPASAMADAGDKIKVVDTIIQYHEWLFSPDLGVESACCVPGPEDGLVPIEDEQSEEQGDGEGRVQQEETEGRMPGDSCDLVRSLVETAMACQNDPPLSPGLDSDIPRSFIRLKPRQGAAAQSRTDRPPLIRRHSAEFLVTDSSPPRNGSPTASGGTNLAVSEDMGTFGGGVKQLSFDCLLNTYDEEARSLDERAQANLRDRHETAEQRRKAERELRQLESELEEEKQSNAASKM